MFQPRPEADTFCEGINDAELAALRCSDQHTATVRSKIQRREELRTHRRRQRAATVERRYTNVPRSLGEVLRHVFSNPVNLREIHPRA